MAARRRIAGILSAISLYGCASGIPIIKIPDYKLEDVIKETQSFNASGITQYLTSFVDRDHDGESDLELYFRVCDGHVLGKHPFGMYDHFSGILYVIDAYTGSVKVKAQGNKSIYLPACPTLT